MTAVSAINDSVCGDQAARVSVNRMDGLWCFAVVSRINLTKPSAFNAMARHTGTEVAGSGRHSPRCINPGSGAAITFVGLGCPRQEVWAYEFRTALSMPLVAVGAAFAFHAGRLAQAPAFLQDHGLEWFYRLLKEPRRLWKRYLLLNPLYVSLIALQLTGLRNSDTADSSTPIEELLYG